MHGIPRLQTSNQIRQHQFAFLLFSGITAFSRLMKTSLSYLLGPMLWVNYMDTDLSAGSKVSGYSPRKTATSSESPTPHANIRHALLPRSTIGKIHPSYIHATCRLPFVRDINVCGDFFPCPRSVSYCIDPCDVAVSVLDRRSSLLNWPPVFLKVGES